MNEVKASDVFKKDKVQGLDEAMDQALNELKQEPAIYRLIHDEFHLTRAETRRSLNTLLDYREDLHYCSRCPGYEKCAKEVPHYQMNLTYENGLMDRQLVLCDLARKRMAYESSFIDRDFPYVWHTAEFVDLKGKAKAPLKTAMLKSLTAQDGRWFYVQGSRGVGRTFALAVFANAWVKQQRGDIAFVETSGFMERMKTLALDRDKSKFAEEMERYQNCSLLVLDDFGNEAKDKTGFGYGTILFPLLDVRAKKGLCTCFSSDFTLDEVASMYAASIGRPRARQLKDLILSMGQRAFSLIGLPGFDEGASSTR